MEFKNNVLSPKRNELFCSSSCFLLTLHVDHLAGHFVVRRIVGIVEGLIRLQHLGRGDDQTRAYRSLQVVLLQGIRDKISFIQNKGSLRNFLPTPPPSPCHWAFEALPGWWLSTRGGRAAPPPSRWASAWTDPNGGLWTTAWTSCWLLFGFWLWVVLGWVVVVCGTFLFAVAVADLRVCLVESTA